MVAVSRKRGFTLIELLVVITIIAALMGMLLPAIKSVTETTHKLQCANNLRSLGLAMKTFHTNMQYFPPACASTAPAGSQQAVPSWSWLAYLLPYLDRVNEYKNIGRCGNGNLPWQANSTDKVATANLPSVVSTPLPFLICPTIGPAQPPYTGAPAQLPGNSSGGSSGTINQGAITNYKGMGATQKTFLTLAITNSSGTSSAANTYPTDGQPDGVLFPSANDMGITETQVGDSQSATIMAVETQETQLARWILGSEATLAGLPGSSDQSPVTIAQCGTNQMWAPQGYTGDPTTLGTGWDSAMLTFINYGYPQNKYDTTSSPNMTYGPSSKHLGVTNHLFVDGNARAIVNTVDVAAYMFMITRNGGESLGKYGMRILPP
jgi:prepilin-type N-terminal cleavage/methylation domain-containing protein